MPHYSNDFVAYLNSLHSLGADGANALAESQALNPHFGGIYEPIPLVGALVNALTEERERVIVLTGHAGDGKSTIALDVYKRLKALPAGEPLLRPLAERECIDWNGARIVIVKDMSELGAAQRLESLGSAFSERGSWLIITNTGPLLQSLVEYANESGCGGNIEGEILQQLDQPIASQLQSFDHVPGFNKELAVFNLTRLENHQIGASVLGRIAGHSGWDQCRACDICGSCPLARNRQAVSEAAPEVAERIRWIYQLLGAYEQRLTLRQIVAQLALAFTGGMTCAEARKQVEAASGGGADDAARSLGFVLFSEGFFGYRNGLPCREFERLKAVSLVRRIAFGGPVAVEYERTLSTQAGAGWATLPQSLAQLSEHWQDRASSSASVRWRFALRRMIYIFGKAGGANTDRAHIYLDAFLHSPCLRQYDEWKAAKRLTLTQGDAIRLLKSCLNVLLEIYSGFCANQFDAGRNDLYLTLRRSDQAVVQPTQLILETAPLRDFELQFDAADEVLVLHYARTGAKLKLTLPLLDFIHRRDAGELGNTLSPIHLAQLDWFRAKILQASAGSRPEAGKIEVLRAGLDGSVHRHGYYLDDARGILEPGL
jgi:hypothetical protein